MEKFCILLWQAIGCGQGDREIYKREREEEMRKEQVGVEL
jgi:hypothetical protein